MDDATIRSLETALRATPENAELLAVLLRARLEQGEAKLAHDLLEGVEPTLLKEASHRALAATVCRENGDDEAALRFASEDSPEELMVRARSLLALERLGEGRAAYSRAVSENPTLEDPELAKALAATIRTFTRTGRSEGEGPGKLRVISNDDTEQSELQRLLMPAADRVTFAEVGGLEDLKAAIRKRIVLPFQKPSLFRRFRKRVGGGILLYGPPGCGKTLLARATAGECDASFFNVTISDILDMYIGESEARLHAVFEKARQSRPAVLFFDELEGLGGKRQYTREATSSKLVSQFLSELDGYATENEGVLVLGATNVPWAVDAAFRRPGRFDRVVFVPPPDRGARERILEILLAERPCAENLDLASVARNSSGFSGADLRNLVDTAVDAAIEASLDREAEVPVSMAHLRGALKDVKPTTAEWLTTARNHARYANEAGHYDDVLDFLRKHAR